MAAFVQVLLIDLVLAGDNAIVVGALAAGLPADQRKQGHHHRCSGRARASHCLCVGGVPIASGISV